MTDSAKSKQYDDVNLRAVELLARAQTAADETVAEAQLYARDLEKSARDQYREIIQQAQESARANAADDDSSSALTPVAAPTAEQLHYVRTYARVAHSQLKSILGVLEDELEKLADIAETGAVTSQSPVHDEPRAGAPARIETADAAGDLQES